jgi:uncharacterized membrane protein YidH (DUF202 family)
VTASSGDVPGRRPEFAAQLERTALAWQRTALGVAVNGALLVRAATGPGTGGVIAGGALMGLGVAMWVAASRTYRGRRGTRAGTVLAGYRGANVALTLLAVALALLNAAAVLTWS